MSSKNIKNISLTFLILILLLGTGYCLSQRKVIWIDEIFTQNNTIDTHSYANLLSLQFTEGNKSPLFYIIQKMISDMFSFRLPDGLIDGSHILHDERSQVIMRISSNISMSLGLAIIFYFFTSQFSLWTGLYALAVGLSVPMVWMFWVEARPYSLWFLLTTIQLCLAYRGFASNEKSKTTINRALLITHLLLSLTTVIAIFQISIVSFMLWSRGYYKKQWSWFIPFAITLFYYWAAPAYGTKAYYFWPHLLDAVMPEHLLLFAFYGMTLWYLSARKKPAGNTFFFLIFLLFLSSACFMLFIFSLKKTAQFGFFTRYLTYMVPVDIMMMPLMAYDFMKWAKINKGLWVNTGILLGGLLICRALLTYSYMLALSTYSHIPG